MTGQVHVMEFERAEGLGDPVTEPGVSLSGPFWSEHMFILCRSWLEVSAARIRFQSLFHCDPRFIGAPSYIFPLILVLILSPNPSLLFLVITLIPESNLQLSAQSSLTVFLSPPPGAYVL